MNYTVQTHTQVDWGGLNVNTVCKQAPGIYNGKDKSGAGKTLFPSNVISMFFPISCPVRNVSGIRICILVRPDPYCISHIYNGQDKSGAGKK